MTKELKIGDTLWRYNTYADNRMGRDGNMMDPWDSSYKIIGESKTHWHTEPAHSPLKVNKKTLYESARSGNGAQWYTAEGMREVKFRKAHAREIARIIGYKIKENE